MHTTFGQTSAFRIASCALALGALFISSPAALAARRPCDCDNLEQIEEHIAQQEFLHKLFQQWADYMPASLLTPDDVRQRANALFLLSFYGVPTEVPHGTGSGAGATAGTLLNPDEHCPLVKYKYDKKGNPVLRETQRSREENRNPPELEHAWDRITERQYPSRECAAIVNFTLAHERHHRHTCQSSSTPKSSWDNAQFFAKDDRDAYQAGLDILYAERARLKRKCEKRPARDGRWRGVLEYAYVYHSVASKVLEKGSNSVYLDAVGEEQRGDRKSVRARASIDAPAAGGNIKLRYKASRQEAWFNKITWAMPGECGWYKKTDWKFDAGSEIRSEGKTSGTADGVLRVDEQSGTLAIDYRVPEISDGTQTQHEWNKPQGTCGKRTDEQSDRSWGRVQRMPGISVSMKVEIDPQRPDDIEVVRIQPDGAGKGQHYWALRLHRQPAE
ncbi:hypothetical protein [Peristeroidobacter agariperforans]|uniref:hypothetical protein n=1 Tax=Peristeroidobacter agariperforans TaxID=268404 RepID=UPI00101B7088|nr:hypothetical protein [Peristeroidobacter agariperforans]